MLDTLNGKNFDKLDWKQYLGQKWTAPAKTGVPLSQLKILAQKIETLPEGMILQPQVAKTIEDRRKMTAGEMPLNWGYAETMAYATLLNEGYPIRMSGQDIKRGTFAHRHAALYDYNDGKVYIPLEQVAKQPAKFVIVDSLLSEEAVLAFEYGCASSSPNALIIWEAQYGDFVNGAQVVIDQFISSGEQKWGRLCGLTMLLPHGYEGQGPEHSSARLERFLQSCAEDNVQVCVPTTPAQIFHLLRRQMIRPYRKPLIVLTPKSLLRAKLATSSLTDLAEGEFQNIIPEIDNDVKANSVERVILCSGKVYYELLEQRRTDKKNNIAIIRIEQLYPFPAEILINELQRYKKAKEVIWCQEEPQNQGAWYSIVHSIKECLTKSQTLHYVGRPASASPAAGAKQLHVEQQKALITEALK
jgi:2-oxoglutarate dehydrogenase E1 component